MKKNILAIAILAATIANIALSAIIILVIVPEAKQSTALIEKIVSCLDLELQNPNAGDFGHVELKDRVQATLCEKKTITLTNDPGETKTRYAQVNCYLILNKKSADYTAVTEAIEGQREYLSVKLDKIVSVYTASNLKAGENEIASEMLETLKAYVDSPDCILEIVVNALIQ